MSSLPTTTTRWLLIVIIQSTLMSCCCSGWIQQQQRIEKRNAAGFGTTSSAKSVLYRNKNPSLSLDKFHTSSLLTSSSFQRQRQRQQQLLKAVPSEIIDAEIEDSEPSNETSVDFITESFESYAKDQDMKKKNKKSLLDLSLESDPEISELRVPFLAVDGTQSIDTRLSFTVQVDNVTYGIGVPYDHAVAITLETNTNNNDDGSGTGGTIISMSPDMDDNEEIMEIMAKQLHDQYGKDLQLKRTPRVLTIVGPLENYTKNWQSELFPDPIDLKSLMKEEFGNNENDNQDDDDDEFDHAQYLENFLREQMGDVEFEKSMNEPIDDFTKELLPFFDVPGFGDLKDDDDAMSKLVEDAFTLDADIEMEKLKSYGEDLDHEGVALKLVSFVFKEGKAYSLVKLLKPYMLVARQVINEEEVITFELITQEEEKILIPRLEDVCKNELEKAGLASKMNSKLN